MALATVGAGIGRFINDDSLIDFIIVRRDNNLFPAYVLLMYMYYFICYRSCCLCSTIAYLHISPGMEGGTSCCLGNYPKRMCIWVPPVSSRILEFFGAFEVGRGLH